MANLISILYDISRTTGRVASRTNDIKSIASGHPERVLKKAAKREMHKNLNKILRGL